MTWDGWEMGRSTGVMMTVKVPVNWERMTKRQRQRLDKITRRDTRVIKAYLGVIERHEHDLLSGRPKPRIDAGLLDQLTLLTKSRNVVPHDLKKRFPNISTNELQECRETAIGMWETYLATGRTRPLRARKRHPKKIPRHIFRRLFEFVYTPSKTVKHWLILRDSLDSVRDGRRRHDRLAVPLNPSSYHLSQLKRGELKSIQILKDHRRKWWVLFRVRLTPKPLAMTSRPPAVLAIDLGIKKTACSVLLTQDGIRHVRFWKQKEKEREMARYDSIIASLQEKRSALLRSGQETNGVVRRLKTLSSRRQQLSIDYDRKLVKQLAEHILSLSESYDLHVGIGMLTGIRGRARRETCRNPRHRRMINRWSFARVTELLTHKLRVAGLSQSRIRAVPEYWTSVTCSKCGRRGLRPKQSLFLCPTCGYRANADMNAAINIGRRLIRLIPSLWDENGLGQWLLSNSESERATPKARRSVGSQGRSAHSKRSPTSLVGVTVADRYDQTSLEEYVSGTDPAMGRTMGRPSAAVESGNHGTRTQRTEAESGARDSVPMTFTKRHAQPAGEVLLVAGDNSHDEG